MGGVTLCLRISLFSYILLLFENDDQRKNNFSISHMVVELWPVEIFTLGGDLPCKHSFFAHRPMQFACTNTLHRCTKIGFWVFWRARNPNL